MARGSLARACVLVSVLASVPAHAASPTPSQLAAARNLMRSGHWEIGWDDETGSPAMLAERRASLGAAHRRLRKFDAVARSHAFFDEYAGLFPIREGLDSLVVIGEPSSRRSLGTVAVRFLQRYRGLPVHGGGYAVGLSPEGHVLFVNGRFYPGIEVDPEPSIDAKEAEAIAVRDVGEGADRVTEPITSLVTTRAGNYRLAWSITVPQDWAHVWVVHVDAHDGSVIERGNRVRIEPR